MSVWTPVRVICVDYVAGLNLLRRQVCGLAWKVIMTRSLHGLVLLGSRFTVVIYH